MKNFKEMVYGNLFEAKLKNPKKAELENPDKADLNNDGNLSGYEITRATAIEKSMKKKGKLEEEEKKPSKQDVTEKDVLKILKDQGGAADLKKVKEELKKIGKKVPADKALKAMVGKIKTVTLHRDGDYVEITGLNKKDVLSKMTKK